MLNKNIPIGGVTMIHSNPSNENGESVDPPSNVAWGADGSFGSLEIQGAGVGDPLQRNAKFTGTAPGVTVINMACAGKSAQVQVTVEAPVILPFDHFSPSFD